METDDSQPKMKKCPYCSEEILVDAIKCKHCGEWLDKEHRSEHIDRTVSEPIIIPLTPSPHKIEKISDVTPVWIFIILNILSLGLYQIYWFYKTWGFFKEKEKSDISPIGRAIFSLVFAYTLFEKILILAETKGHRKGFPAGVVAVVYYIFTMIVSGIGSVYTVLTLISAFTFIPLISVLEAMNVYYRSEQPGYKERDRPLPIEIGIAILGIILWVIIIMSMY